MTVRAGNAPWNNYKAISGNTDKGMVQDLSGWHLKQKHTGKRHQRTLTGTDGKKYKLYSWDDDVPLGFSATGDDERLAYAEEAFDKKKGDHGQIFEEEGCGHISYVEYSEKYQVLRVTFANDDVCVFFRVPTAVAGQLLHWARKQTIAYTDHKTGIKRHKLGVEFWNLVRIRGSVTGARYPFEYEQKVAGKYVTGANKRFMVTMTPEDYENYFQKKYNRHVESDNMKIGVMVTKAELTNLLLELAQLASGEKYYGAQGASHAVVRGGKSLQTSAAEDEIAAIDARLSGESSPKDSSGTGSSVEPSHHQLLDLANKFKGKAAQKLQEFLTDNDIARRIVNEEINITNETGNFDISPNYAARRVMKKEYNLWTASGNEKDPMYQKMTALKGMTDMRGMDVKDIHNIRGLKSLAKALGYDPKLVTTWLTQRTAMRTGQETAGRLWTKRELKDFANQYVPGNISPEHSYVYKQLIDAGDYEAALGFLKSHHTSKTYYDKKGVPGRTIQTTYAGSQDRLAQDEED